MLAPTTLISASTTGNLPEVSPHILPVWLSFFNKCLTGIELLMEWCLDAGIKMGPRHLYFYGRFVTRFEYFFFACVTSLSVLSQVIPSKDIDIN